MDGHSSHSEEVVIRLLARIIGVRLAVLESKQRIVPLTLYRAQKLNRLLLVPRISGNCIIHLNE